MKLNTTILAVIAATIGLTIGSANAAKTININFMRTAATTPAANDGSEYGISTWADVVGSTGATVQDGVSVSWSSTGTWSGGGNNVENGYLDNLTDISITGLSAWLTLNSSSAYTVQLIQASDTASNTFGDTLIKDTDGSGALLDTLTNANLQRGATTVSVDLTADNLFVDPTTVNGTRTNVAGLIITAVPEPSSAALIGLAGLALIFRRRK